MFIERRTEMRPNHFGIQMVDRFLAAPTERGFESLKPPSSKPPVLYLKCWGPDYPYLRGGEQHKRWLPVPVDSAPSL